MTITVYVLAIEMGSPYVGSLAGTRRYGYSMVRSLASKDIELHIATTHKMDKDEPLLDLPNVHFYELPKRKEGRGYFRRRKGTIVRDCRHFSNLALKHFYELNEKINFSLIHAIDFSAISFLKAKKRGKIHQPIVVSLNPPIRWFLWRKNLLKRAEKLLVPSKYVEHKLGLDKQEFQKKLHVIPPSINCKVYAKLPRLEDIEMFREKYALKSQKTTLMLIGPFIPRKGQLEILEILPIILRNESDVQFLLVGEGPQLPKIKEKVVEWEIEENTSITGYINDFELKLAYHTSDLLAYPSKEGSLGSPIIEAMSTGLPVFASDISPYNEIVPENSDCLYPVGKQEKLVEKILRFIEDKEYQRKLFITIKEYAMKEFDYDVIGKRLEKIYSQIL